MKLFYLEVIVADDIQVHVLNSEEAIFNILKIDYAVKDLDKLKEMLSNELIKILPADWSEDGELMANGEVGPDELLELAVTHLKEFKDIRKKEADLEKIKSKMKEPDDFRDDILDRYNSGEIELEEMKNMIQMSNLMKMIGKKAILLDDNLMKELEEDENNG